MLKIASVTSFAFLFSASVFASNPFFFDKERGWLWREEPVIDEKEKIKEIPPPPASPSESKPEEMVELDVAWLKSNMERLMVAAINNPSHENLASFAYAQRLMLDTSSRFSSKMTEFMMLEDTLNESNRRPLSQFAINSFKGEQRVSIRDVFDSVKQRSGIWFFFSSECEYCQKQVPVLRQLNAQYGIDILAISMDGGVLPGMEKFEVVMDYNLAMSEKFGVSSTPSLFMVDSKNMDVIAIAEGLQSLQEIEEKVMLLAKERGFVSDEEYMLTRGVREINVFRNSNGQVLADKEKLESDPGYLADLLRAKLKDLKPYGTVPVSEEK